MRSSSLVVVLACLVCCGAPSTPTQQGGQSDESVGLRQPCQELRSHVTQLYTHAAADEAVPLNRRAEFVSANLDMVLADCLLEPELRASCAASAPSVAYLEERCLQALDDDGSVEGQRFAAQ